MLIAKKLKEYDIYYGQARALIAALEDASLLPASPSLAAAFKSVKKFIHGILSRDAAAVEYTISIDPLTGTPSASRKVEFKEKTEAQSLEEIPVEELLELANEALKEAGVNVWVLFDRLDVAFTESPDLERNALRALFRTYIDLKAHPAIGMKIFVRDDIWRRISDGGFTEASHITKSVHISWDEDGLLNLVALRLLNNPILVEYLDIDPEKVKSDDSKQGEMFYSIAPRKVDTGKNPDTFHWMLSRTKDASGNAMPREVIHLLEETKNKQVSKLERGGNDPEGTLLLDRMAFKDALRTVSKIRYEQTLIAEYPEMIEFLQKLEKEKSEQNVNSLSRIWKVDAESASGIAKRLSEIGFFEIRGSKEDPDYWVPFIYRAALELVQGKAEE